MAAKKLAARTASGVLRGSAPAPACSSRWLSGLRHCTSASSSAPGVPEPTAQQLRAHALQNAVPMVGFGIVDCVVMTQVGSAMEVTLGASLGIAPITAAAIGLFCSDSCGVLFGGTIEGVAGRFVPAAGLTAEQLESAQARRSATLGRLFGVELGVILGSTTLLFQKSPEPSKKSEDSEGDLKATKDELLQERKKVEALEAELKKTKDQLQKLAVAK
eukprot:TRINITY_DN2184_c1_g1_i7.p3 TRINITY_DN2184_c1_g1~~TRINITY_DN2184_c1_g1_i7.p3  ORF type:complete len:217 (-),score=60.62 TRINITY_DN2184_c1_g1_i7:152-802(-)